MSERVLMKGNEAAAEAAIRGGCRYFFGYPITPQNELPAYMARRLPEVGGVFLQAESELAAINMVYGAAGAGARAMTSSSSPGISLKQEGISYLAGAELPAVIINMMRGGPGLGGIGPSQSDYFQATKGGGHGDYRLLVYGPSTVQELVDLVYDSFEKAEQYRLPVLILGDGMLGQIMEPVELPPFKPASPEPSWATTGANGRPKRVVNSLYLDQGELEALNRRLQERLARVREAEVRYEVVGQGEPEVYLVAYGTMARIARGAMEMAAQAGLRVGLVRPISLWPFPDRAFAETLARGAKRYVVFEMSHGQMVEDVRLAVNGRAPVEFYGRTGVVPSPEELFNFLEERL